MWRVVFVGLGLLTLTLAAFFGMKSQGAGDALARTAAANALTVEQVFFLLVEAEKAFIRSRRTAQVAPAPA